MALGALCRRVGQERSCPVLDRVSLWLWSGSPQPGSAVLRPLAKPFPMPSVLDEFALCLHFSVSVYFPARPPVLHCRDVPRLQVIKIRAGRFSVVAPWLPGPWLFCFPSQWISPLFPRSCPCRCKQYAFAFFMWLMDLRSVARVSVNGWAFYSME